MNLGRIVALVLALVAAAVGLRFACRVSPTSVPTPGPTLAAPPGGYIYRDDFEGDSGWAVGAEIPGRQTWKFGLPARIRALSGKRVLGTLGWGGHYEPGEWSHALSPPWSLPAGSAYMLACHHWWEFDSGADGGRIEASTDGGRSWMVIEPAGGYPNTIAGSGNHAGWPPATSCFGGASGGWRDLQVPLAKFAGTTLRLRFIVSADGSGHAGGWYLDDVYVY